MNRQEDTQSYPPMYEPEADNPQDEPINDLQDDENVEYVDYSQTGFEEEEYSDYNEELDDTHRFHVAMNVLDLIGVLAGLAVILILVALLVSLLTWLQSDISQSFTLLASQLK